MFTASNTYFVEVFPSFKRTVGLAELLMYSLYVFEQYHIGDSTLGWGVTTLQLIVIAAA